MNIKKLINYKKFISVITATCLLVSFVVGPTVASAISNEQTTKEYNQIFKEFILPYSYGKITNSHFAGTDRVIINIQDLHCHPKVQKNISNIIETFDKKFGVKKIYLEGAYGNVSTKWITNQLDNNKNIIEKMLDTGRLTGAEYYSALSGKTDLIKGLEEQEPYLENIKRLGGILQNQENINLILKSLHDCTDKVKKKYYTKRQYKLESLFNEYKEGKIPSQKYYTLLSKHIDKLGIDLTKYENSLIYITLLEIQKNLNYKQITRELQELISVLKQQLPYNVYKSLLENTENFKEIEKFYSYIVQLDKTCNLEISSNFKELDRYFKYIELSKKINPIELVKEDEFLIQEINTRFAQTKAQQDVIFLTYFEKYLRDYLTTKITLDDYEYYKNNIEKYRHIYNKYVDNRVLSLLDEYIVETDKFYNINLARNTYFTKNIFKENELLNKIENNSLAQDDIGKIIDNMQQVKELDIVITGGFHSQTVTDLLKNKNVSYIVITPNVTDGIKLAEDTYYELAKEQSKISFQTIAPVIASLSPKLQEILLEKTISIKKEEIDKIISLDDTEKAKIISKLLAANLLESDDLGDVETKIQEVIKAIVDDLHKEKITPELISQIKNLQKLIKDTESLQKVIDLLHEGTIKQSLMLVSDMFAKLYTVFDSFVAFANRKLAQQEKISSIKYIENLQTDKSSKKYYDEAEEKQEKTSKNINEFFNRAEKNKSNLVLGLSGFFADTFEIKEETVDINKGNNPFYLDSVISFIVIDKITKKEYKISIESFLNITTMDFSIEIEGASDREKYTPLLDKLAQEILNGNFEIEEELKPEAEGKNSKIYYDEAEEKQEGISKRINEFFNRAEKNKSNLILGLSGFFADTFEIKEETVDINNDNNPFYPTSIISFVVIDKVTNKEYKISLESFLNILTMSFSIEIEGISDREKYVPLLDKLAQKIINGNFKIDNIISKKETQNKVSKGDIKQLKREIIKAGKNNKDIIDFVNYLARHDMSDYELLNKILAELRKLEDWEILGYCAIIYALTNKDNRKNDKEKALKTKENIMSFFEKPKLLQLKFCDLFSNFFKGYNDYINEDFFGALLDYVNKNKYDEQDFDLLFEICESSIFIAELGTKENMYDFLLLNMEKRIQIYEFYISSRDNFDIDINRLTLNFILSVAQKYDLSKEQFNYLMKLICLSNLTNTDIEKIYVDGLKEKDINLFVLDKFKDIRVYNKYLLDLLFSDINEKYIKDFDYKIQRIIDLFDELQKYEIANLETENKALALVVFLSDNFEKYCKDNNIEDIVKQYQLAIRVTRRIYSLSGNNIFDISESQIEKIINKTLDYYKQIDEIISLISAFTNKTAVFSLYNNERSFDGIQRFTPTGLKEIFKVLNIEPEVCYFVEVSFIDTVLNFINSKDGQYLYKKEILEFIDNTEGSSIVKETLKKYINSIKETTISKKNIISYIERTKEKQIESEIENFLNMLENFNKYEQERGTFLFDGHGLNDSFYYSKTGKITIERLVNSLITAHNNGVNLENISLMFSCCNSYDFAGKIITSLINNGVTVFPQIITDAGKETIYAYDRQIDTSLGETRVSNLFYSLLMSLKNKTSKEIEDMKGRLTFKEIADVPRYLSNNTVFMTNKRINELNEELNKNIRQIIEEFDSEDKERFYPYIEEGKYVGTYNPYVELQILSTQQILEKIGNLKIIKRLYRTKSGKEFRFTKLGVAIGVLLETISFWLPNFVNKHNFNPGDKARMTAVVWVIRALSIGIGFATGSVFAVFLAETIAHFIWNILSIRASKKALLLQQKKQETDNVTKEQLLQDIFLFSGIEQEGSEDDKNILYSVVNKTTILKRDIRFISSNDTFFTDDYEINSQRILVFLLIINLLRQKNLTINNSEYEQIVFLAKLLTSNEINKGKRTDIIFEFFNLKQENRQKICDKLKDIIDLDTFELMLKVVEECEKNNSSKQEINDILTLIEYNQKPMAEYYYKDLKDKALNVENLRFFSKHKNKPVIPIINFVSEIRKYNYALWLSLIYSDVDLNSLIGNDETKLKVLIDLMKSLDEVEVSMLDTENSGLTLKIFLNEEFNKNVENQYKKEGKRITILDKYRVAQKIARTLYDSMGDKVLMLSDENLNDIIGILVTDNARRRAVAEKINFVSENIGVIAIHNMEESKSGSRIYTLKGIEKVMSLLKISAKLKTDFVIKDEDDVKDKADEWLKSIENFLTILENNGLTSVRYVFDGHGTDKGLFLKGNDDVEATIFKLLGIKAPYSHITVKEVSDSLFKAYQKCIEQGKEEKFEDLILDLSSCHSYEFAQKVINRLKQLEEDAGLPLRFPQIITESGKETIVGYSTIYTEKETGNKIRLSNMEYSLIKYLEGRKDKQKSNLTLRDLFDAQIYLSNHTIFISNDEIESLNIDLRKELYKVLGKEFFSEEELKTESDERLPVRFGELQLPSTQKILSKIGNNKIVRKIYKDKAGNNFKFTKLGVAIGVLLETFSFWLPNFVNKHNFNPGDKARMTAVVWVIRALSIGIGFATGSVFAVFLAETIAHFVWNITAPSHLKLQYTESKEIVTEYSKKDIVTVLLITKEDGTQYSVRLALSRITEEDKVKQDYIKTDVPDRKMFVYLSSVNDDAFSMATSKYTTIEYIERITGVKIEVTGNTISAKSTDPETSIVFVKNRDIPQTVSSLIPEQIPAIEQQEQADVENIAQSEVTETICLDESPQEIKRKFKKSIENNSLIVIYPFSTAYDIDSLTEEQLYSLYFDIQSKFLDLQEMLEEYLPKVDDRRGMEYVLKEFIKNAFVHGNLSDPAQPIYIKFIKNGFTVINEAETLEDEQTRLKRLNLSAAATLTGAHRGLQIIRDYEEVGLIKLEQEIKTKEVVTADGKKKEVSYYIVSAVRTSEKSQTQTKIDFNSLIERVFKIIPLIEKTNNKYPGDRAKSMTEAEEILTQTFTPEELEIIDLLASVIFDSIKYVNSTRNTSAVEFVNVIYSLQNGLFNDNLLMHEGDLKQHILNMLKHYVEISKQKKGEECILFKTVQDDESVLGDMADFLTDIIIKNNLIQKAKQQREQRRKNISKFIEGVQKDDTSYSAVMICSANENRSAIWHIMFEDFLKRTKRKMTRVFSAGVFYDISQEVIRQTGKARVLRDDYHETLTFDERYKGIDESIKSDFRSTYIKYLRLPKGSQKVFIVAGEQHRAQLIKLGYDPNWIFLMSEFYSDDFKIDFKQTHEILGKELEENNIFSMSEYPDPFEEQILRQDLPELTKSLIEYVFKTEDDVVRENIPERFVKFTDDYNQFEHMENLPSFAFTDDEKREATRELYQDEVSDLVMVKHQFEFRANTKYLYILQNRNNKDALLDIVLREDAELKIKLFALMYLNRMRRGLSQQELDAINITKDKMVTELKKQLETNSFNILNNFDLRAYMMGIYLMLQEDSLKKPIPEIIYNAFIINKSDRILANSDGYFSEVDLFTIVHELTHVVVSKPVFYRRLVADTVDELVSYITPNLFLSMVKLSLESYLKAQDFYTIHQSNGLIDYVKMGKKLQVLYNLFSEKTSDFNLRQEEHKAPIAFLELLFNAHIKIGKTVDWSELFETIKTMQDKNFNQSSMLRTTLTEYAERLVEKGTLSKQEADNLIKEIEKMQMWTLLTYDIVQNIKNSDPDTYNKILGNKSAISFEEQILSKPAETKEQLKRISDVIKSKEQLSKNDILTLLIINIIYDVDYEQLINNFEGVIEGIMNAIRISAQMFDMQKETYSLSEYEQIAKYVTDNYNITQNSAISIIDNIFDFIANSLDQLFFAELLINQVFGTKSLINIIKDKKLLIVTSKQQEETLQQVLKNNNVEDIEIVTMEIITEPVTDMRSDMVLDVQKGIKVRYDTKENKLIVYSKQGISITEEEIQSLIMQEYFAERSEDIVAEDVIAFASLTDTTFEDITNRLKTAYTASVTMPNKETKFDLSSKKIANFAAVCNQEFTATGIKTFVVTYEQAEKFFDEIKTLQEQGFRFVISCKSDSIADITDYDGLVINAVAITNLDQAIKFMESIKKKVLTQGVAKQVSIKFNDDIYSQFEYLSIDIFNTFGIMPVINAERLRNVGKYEVENVTENNIEQLLRSNNVIGLVIDNARVFVGKKNIIKQLFSKEHKYNKGYNASLSSKFDYICYDVPALVEILNIDINNDEDLNRLKSIDLSKLSLSLDSLTYLEYLQKKGNYEEMVGFIRGISMNTARVQIIKELKEKGIDLDMEKFAKEANGKYQKAFLTVAVQLMIEGIDITKLLETDFIDSDMTTKQYLDSVLEKVNINIEDILKQNEYKIQRTENTAKTIEDFKNYVVLLDNLKIVKETTAGFDMSMKAVRSMLAAA